MVDLLALATKAETIATSDRAREALAFWAHSQSQSEWRRKRERAGVSPAKLDAIKGRIERLRGRAASPPPQGVARMKGGPPPQPRDILTVDSHDIGVAGTDDPLRTSPDWLVMGRGVWFQPALPAGVIRFIRCQISGRRDQLGRYHVISIDDPKQQFYASVRQLRPRFAGEVAPGVSMNPNGDDAA